MDSSALTQFLVILAVLMTFVINQVTRAQDKRDARNRDEAARLVRDRIAAETKREIQERAAEIAETLRLRAEVLELQAAHVHSDLVDKIAENTAITTSTGNKADSAYHEANDANRKLAVLEGNVQKTLSIAQDAADLAKGAEKSNE